MMEKGESTGEINQEMQKKNLIKITVKFSGRSIPINNLSSDSTIKDLKILLQPLTNVLPRGQKLIFSGKVLEDQKTLKSSEVKNGSKIMLIASQVLHQGIIPAEVWNCEASARIPDLFKEPVSTSKKSVPGKGASSVPIESGSAVAGQPFTEDEIRAVLTQEKPVTIQDLVAKFKSRVRTMEDKNAFAAILWRISRIWKTNDGRSFVVLRIPARIPDLFEEPVSTSKKSVPGKGASLVPIESGSAVAGQPFTEDEIRAVLTQEKPVTIQDLVAKFKSRLRTMEDKNAFAAMLKRISKIRKTNDGKSFVVLREMKPDA